MKLEIFGADWCIACKRAKTLAKEKNVEFEFYDISEDPEALTKLKGYIGHEPKTIPQIFNEDGHIGGYDELKILLK